jgi:hypothetical protein
MIIREGIRLMKKIRASKFSIILLFVFLTAIPAFAASVNDGFDPNTNRDANGFDLYEGIYLPKTGQSTCYNASGAETPCTFTGQDGDVQAGDMASSQVYEQ